MKSMEGCRTGKGMRKSSGHFKHLSIFRDLYDVSLPQIPANANLEGARPVTSPAAALYRPMSFSSRVLETLASVPAGEASGTSQEGCNPHAEAMRRPGRGRFDFKGLRPKKHSGISLRSGRPRLLFLRTKDPSRSPVASMPVGIAAQRPASIGDVKRSPRLDHGQIRKAAKRFSEAADCDAPKA
jgi:hypothetical protein